MKKWFPFLFISIPMVLSSQLIQYTLPSEVHSSEIINKTIEINTVINENVLDSTVYYRYNEAMSEFDRETKTILIYNNDGLNSKGLIQKWNETSNQWSDDEQYFNTYNGSNQLSESIYQEWTDNEWTNDLKQELQYQGNNLTMLIFSEWVNNAWVNQARFTFEYNVDGNATLFQTEEWSDNQWNNLSRTVSTYDNDGYLIEEVNYMWDGSWVQFSRNVYTNNNDGLPTTVETSIYLGMGTWMGNFRIQSSYNDKNLIAEEIGQFYNPASRSWDNQSRTSYNYDDNDNLIVVLDEFFQGINLVANERTTYQYDDNNNEIESLDEIWLNNQWLKETKLLSYYGSGSTSVSEAGNLNYQLIMANPILKGGDIYFTIDDPSTYTMEIRDINGISMNRLTFMRNIQYQIPSEIPSGICFIIIRNKNHVLISQKVIVL